MTSYKLAGKVIKFTIFSMFAALISYIIYIIIGISAGYIVSECTEYIDVIDIVSVADNKTTILTSEGEMVLTNALYVRRGKDGYCTKTVTIETWRDGK